MTNKESLDLSNPDMFMFIFVFMFTLIFTFIFEDRKEFKNFRSIEVKNFRSMEVKKLNY